METAVTRLAAGARKTPRFLWGDNRRLTMLRIRIAVSREGEDHKLLFPPGPDDGENGKRDPCG